jgi:Domain of unknown function (DUF1707)
MAYGAGGGDQPVPPGQMLASEAERERCQAVLKQAFEDERLTQDEFESRVGSAISARTLDQLAALTRDLPAPLPAAAPAPSRRSRTPWIIGGIVAAAVVAVLIPLLSTLNSTSPQQSSAAPAKAANNNSNPKTTLSGPAKCPVGTSPTALAIANALATSPVYVDSASSLLTTAQANRLQAAINQADPGRIRLAVVTNATLSQGGGERALANAIASCAADGAGVTLVTTDRATYLVTSYNDFRGTSQAVEAALNTHPGLAAGLRDAVKRMASIDPGN